MSFNDVPVSPLLPSQLLPSQLLKARSVESRSVESRSVESSSVEPKGAAGVRVRKSRHAPDVPKHTARALRRLFNDDGAATAEYAVATMAAVGFAGLLIVILRGDEVRVILTDLVRSALSVG